MSLFKVFDIAGSALTAQSVRLNTVASNLANVETAAGSADAVYKPKHPIFQAVLDELGVDPAAAGVNVSNIVESSAPPRKMYSPENALADKEGYVYLPSVSAVEEMANMISAARSYQSNTEVMNTAKQLLMSTIRMGQ